MNTFLKPFVNELNEILCDGLAIGNKKVSFKIRCFICDTPARAAIRGMYKFIYSSIYYVCAMSSRFNVL